MSTTRTINGVEYTIPPGTESVWTAPEDTIVTSAPEHIAIEDLIEQIGCHTLVREQNAEVITCFSEDLSVIWNKFTSNQITSASLSEELAQFRLNRLCDHDGYDQVTVEVIENIMVRMMQEAAKHD